MSRDLYWTTHCLFGTGHQVGLAALCFPERENFKLNCNVFYCHPKEKNKVPMQQPCNLPTGLLTFDLASNGLTYQCKL